MGRLTTHVLDTHSGCPAANMALTLFLAEDMRQLVAARTNSDGRVDGPLLEAETLVQGRYVLRFWAGDYFRARGLSLPDPSFVDVVDIAFGVAQPAENYHVPLLVSPWSWSTYRGS
ncbi:MAG: hydroxyisourate hydrolase [Myxococcota bacterium]